LLGALAGVVLATGASAQVYSIATNPQGSMFFTIGTAISKVASQHTDKQYRVAPYGGSSTYAPMVDKGEIEFGMINGGEVAYAYAGTELFEGKPHPNLRMVAAIIPSMMGFAVRTDSEIKTVADFKGKRLSSEYTAGRVFQKLALAMLATGNLGWSDVQGVPTSNFIEGIDTFIAGRIDVAFITLNISAAQKAMASIKGGWRYVSLPDTPQTAETVASVFPSARPVKVSPGKDRLGVAQDPTTLLVVDFCLFTHDKVPEADVYALTRLIHASQPEMAKVHVALNDFVPANMHIKHPVPFHPGAMKFYQEKGM